MEAPQNRTLQPTVSLFGQFLDVQRVHEAMNSKENVRLLAPRVDALAHRNDAYASEA
jgi:hypothetical protein